jgi:LysR family glycine cleavage system transcriptional activator
MSDRLPPLLWVRVFEAAARHGNFVAAARELSVSAGAVSRTVKELEEFMGVELFVRKARGVELTAAAAAYARAIAPAIRQIAQASVELRASAQHQSLRVTAMPALAQRWLVPRLGEFYEQHPDITVMVSAESAVLDLANSAFDVALRHDSGEPEGCELVELFREELYPVLSPKLAAKANLRSPQDLFGLTALHDTYWESDWAVWLAAQGLEAPRRWRSLYFTLYTMAVDAAVAGQGVLIGHAALLEEELRRGDLVAPFPQKVSSPKRYYAVVRADRAVLPAVKAFIEWLRGCATPSAPPPPAAHPPAHTPPSSGTAATPGRSGGSTR